MKVSTKGKRHKRSKSLNNQGRRLTLSGVKEDKELSSL